MRIKIFFYVIIFTYLSLIFIKNIGNKPPVDLIFTEANISLVLIFLASIFLGFVLGGIFFTRKKRRAKKKNKDVNKTDDIKNET